MIDEINKFLKEQGTNVHGQVMHRIVWSDTTFEFRKGVFREFADSGLFLREIAETREVLKYPYLKGRYIFEKWAPGHLTRSAELPNADNGDYIPVYVFEDNKGKPLPVTEKAVRFILSFLEGNIKPEDVPSEAYLEEKEIERNFEIINNHPTFTTTPGITRDSIAYTKELKHV